MSKHAPSPWRLVVESTMKSGYYWAKYVDYPVWQVYYILEDKAYPCSPNRFASWIAVRDLRQIEWIDEPFELKG